MYCIFSKKKKKEVDSYNQLVTDYKNFELFNFCKEVYNIFQGKIGDVAQLGSAFVLGTRCRRFESCHPHAFQNGKWLNYKPSA
jgi:phosphomevalonate kinase